MKSDELIAMTLNPRMTPDAVRVTVYFASLGDGEHPYAFDTLSALLEEGGLRRVRNALARAESCGYLVRHKGGRGTDRFGVTFGPREAVSTSHSALERPVVVERKIEVLPPSPPLVNPLSVKAMQAISDAGTKLAGCRDALRDYLQARVPEGRQYAYVQSVISWLDNPKQVFQQSDGMPVPDGERVKLLAVALNEMAASDETGYAAPSGDVRNVKNKVFILSRGFGKKPTSSAGARASPRSRPSDDQDYGEGTTIFTGLNG